MGRGILTIFIVVAGILSILSGVMLMYLIPQGMTDPDIKGLNIINTTNDEKATGSNPIAQYTLSPPVSEENENIGRIASLPNKCLGSALCPD
ncbi:MAG: hypothetical protein QOK68_08465 [Nitrososphaeraceae archaeon]|nr:hypothetical protein [Nitrososphaeraceae archaeon]